MQSAFIRSSGGFRFRANKEDSEMMTPDQLEQYLHEKIPVSAAMGVRVLEANAVRVVLEAPLEANHNHLGTAFGGSLNTMATLAAYSLLFLALDDMEAHLVIAESSVRYRKPVRHDLRAICRQPEAAALAVFKDQYRRKGKSRISLKATIEEDGGTAVEFEADFVALSL
jgi:thioesterase domain-containing protein